jgi:trimeric autotransporter adhesin
MKKFAFNVLSSATLLATAAVPVVATVAPAVSMAAGSGTITATTVPTVVDGANQAFGTIKVVVPAGTQITTGDSVLVKLPYDMNGGYGQNGNSINVPSQYSGDDNGFFDKVANAPLATAAQAATDRILVTYNGPTANLTNDGVFFINLGSLKVDSGDNGQQTATLEASSTSAFPAGDVVVGNVSSQGQVNISTSSLDNVNDNFTPKINIAESVAGAFTKDNQIKVKLPSGYKWDTANINKANAVKDYGDATAANHLVFAYNDNNRELDITFDTTGAWTTASATKLEIPAPFVVDDESLVKAGDITATVSGKTNLNVSTLVVGTYGDYSTAVSAVDSKDVVSGKSEQQIGDLQIKESVGNTLQNGRTVQLTLPQGATWNEASLNNFKTTEGVHLNYVGLVGSDDRTAKFTVANAAAGSDPATLTLENAEVNLDAAFSGDLNVTVAGSASVTGSVKLASVKAPVALAATTKPSVGIGLSNQAVSDFTITENIAGAFTNETKNNVKNDQVVLNLPEGAKFVGTPKVAVTNGNLSITDVKVGSYNNESDRAITFTVNGESTTASTITVSGVQVQLDRTLPQGDLNVEVGGSALVETSAIANFADTVGKVAVATVGTPAPSESTAKATFTIGQTAYTVNGVQKTLDVAPYTDGGRTYLPIRFVAEALGVSSDNIIWNDATKTVTLINGNRIASFKVGQSSYTVNGAVVPMDAAAQFKQNRNMIPLRYAAQALGVAISWDDATQTVTVGQ